jgi:spore coat protein A
MTASTATPQVAGSPAVWAGAARRYLASDLTRGVQTMLGLIWILDGLLQFQPFMYSNQWITELGSMAAGQPQWLATSISWATGIAGANLPVFNTLFALTQIALGVGLIYRPTVRVASGASLAWSVFVWWFGEAFGMLFMNTANPLTGAPGAVVLYALIALLVWPTGRPGGLLGARGARTTWTILWVAMGWLWLQAANSGDNSVSNAIASAPTGATWLSSLLTATAHATEGIGQPIALLAAGVSALIGVGVGLRWHSRPLLWAAIILSAIYWVFGQAFGGVATGEATDINTAPLFALLAVAMLPLLPRTVPHARDFVGARTADREIGTAGIVHARRAVLIAAGVVVGVAAAAIIAEATGVFNRGGGNPSGGAPVPGQNHNDHNNNDGNGTHDGSDSHGGRDPNAGIQTLTSQAPIPKQFTVPLPVPQQLKPTRQTGDTDYFDIVQTATTVAILPGLKTPVWAYNGTFPGPTIVQNPGRSVVVTQHNDLPAPTVVHLHGGTTPHDSDGYPTDVILPDSKYGTFPQMPAMGTMPAGTDPDATTSRQSRDYTYPPQPRAATLWYHDHRMGFTGASVWRGLAGFHIAHDAEELSLGLPSGAHDVPLMIADRAFAADGSFLYPAVDATMRTTAGVEKQYMNGVMGDVILVNGAPWPVMKVGTAKYRFRILNASNARTYQLALQDSAKQAVPFTQIGTDHGLLAAPSTRGTIQVSEAERYDVIIDFSKHKVGDQITMTNQLGSGPTAVIMRFDITQSTSDSSKVPSKLSTVRAISASSNMTQRTMKFHRGANDWTINDRDFDPTYSEADVPAGSTELWTIISDFHHPFHIHNATMQVIARDGLPPTTDDAGWKDTVFVNEGERVQLAIQFSSYTGRYVFHCHNLEHEDMGMMANFRIT